MPGARLLPLAGLLIALGISAPTLARDPVRIVSPKRGEILLGVTEVRLEVVPDRPVDRIDVYVNGRLVGTALGPEWSVTCSAESDQLSFRIQAVAYAGDSVVAKTQREYAGASVQEYERVDLVQVYPVVTDPLGEYVTDLGARDFQVFEDGNEVPIEYFATEVTSLSIVLLLDVSESMTGKLGQVQVAASDFVEQLGDLDRVGLHAFDHASQELIGLTVDHDRVVDKIWELSPGGGTALYDAVLKAINESLRLVPGRKALFVFSDGMDRHSFSSLDRVVATARDNDVIFYTVGTGEDEGSVEAREDLTALAEHTGGKAFFIKNARQLDGAFETILTDLRAQYVISYRPPEGPAGYREIRLEVAGGRFGTRNRQKMLQLGAQDAPRYDLRYRRSYYYLPAER